MNEVNRVNSLLVETLGEEPTVLVQAGRERDFRKITSIFRGSARTTVDRIIDDVREHRAPTQRVVPDNALSTLGRTGFALPVVGVGNVVYAAHVWTGDEAQDPETVGTWEWELGLEGLPPRLRATDEFFDMFGIGDEYRDRSVYGPADYFGRVVRLADIAELWHAVKTAKAGDATTGFFDIRTDAGELRRIHYAQRFVETDSGPRLRGLCRIAPATIYSTHQRAQMLDSDLSRTLIGLQGMYGLVGDFTIPTAPCVLKWLTSYMPGVGHGVSTGQTPAIHPDDLPQVLGWIAKLRENPAESVSGTLRTRSGGGGWLKYQFVAHLLDHDAFPTLGVVLIYPGTITIEDPHGAAQPR